FSFFFQAEDGIRDFHVTGVQTCALPICTEVKAEAAAANKAGTIAKGDADAKAAKASDTATTKPRADVKAETAAANKAGTIEKGRSEERRVGKECRCQYSPYRKKKKKQRI